MTSHPTSEQVRHIVQAAGLAPSVHNTQPWRFVAHPDRLALHAVDERRLRVLDPAGRQLHLSCGAALMHARVAARAMGIDAAVRLLPTPADPTHLADLLLTVGRPSTDDEVRLATAILHRHTHRGAFDGGQLPGPLVELLRSTAEAEGASLDHLTDEDDLIQLEVLLTRADEAAKTDEQYGAELRRWVHADGTSDDGVPLSATDVLAGSSLQQRDFTLSVPPTPRGSTPVAEHPTVVVLISEDDAPASWLRAGQALAAVLLCAADHGVQAQPLGQVTDVLAYRLGLRQALGIVGLPQLVLRMGFATRSPIAPRRLVEDVLVAVAQ